MYPPRALANHQIRRTLLLEREQALEQVKAHGMQQMSSATQQLRETMIQETGGLLWPGLAKPKPSSHAPQL